ncbi:hypothetical protein [Fredinandcohnia quinoae]|uniref:Uncharacterized protein n=1 Tax=Fredinandcohnia quinoae TaxID=2918902 RepID=A0AAW5E439_9BACI|nr:hypothetical protein [Fredinandcohnia sp. SECRCQ15]MCH1627707.1 hypothetical protein [Fredinandcohnia sp. SECRCQ15]
MKIARLLLLLCILFIFLVGCSSATGNPTPKDFLKYDHADIFLLDDTVFSNSQDIEWVTALDYKLGEQIGEIANQANKAFKFKNGTANKLPIGTKIFETDTPAYIGIVDGEKIPYLKMVEG